MKPYVPRPRRKVQRYRVCAYCGKREYNIALMASVGSMTIRSECQYAHKKCVANLERIEP